MESSTIISDNLNGLAFPYERSILIDNVVIINYGNGCTCSRSVKITENMCPSFNINNVKKITYGNRETDNMMIINFHTKLLTFEDLVSGALQVGET